MPSIDVDFLRQLQVDCRAYTCFVETGTYLGETVFAMEPHFDHLHTIEISEAYHLHTKSRYESQGGSEASLRNALVSNAGEPTKEVHRSFGGDKIRFWLGDSSQVLPALLPEIPGNCIFFLDGHWSAEDTGKGVKDCPLMEELAAIGRHFMHEAVLIIDDCRLFGSGPTQTGAKFDVCNWEDICTESLLSVIRPRISHTYYLDSSCAKNDRLIVHINAVIETR
jgi:hypothetical protein